MLSPSRFGGIATLFAAVLLVPSMTLLADQPSQDGAAGKKEAATKEDAKTEQKADDGKVLSLFDGKSLKGWKRTQFGGEGDVIVEDGAILMEFGSDLTGITWEDATKLPKTNYEISCECRRVDGSDFFCGMTVPVKDSHCSLIVGGWGGGVCGISSLNGYDASENDTTFYRNFEKGRWYRIRMRVLDDRLDVWIDDEIVIEQDITDVKIGTRFEVDLSKPLGFSCWQTTAAVRKIQVRPLSKEDIAKTRKKS